MSGAGGRVSSSSAVTAWSENTEGLRDRPPSEPLKLLGCSEDAAPRPLGALNFQCPRSLFDAPVGFISQRVAACLQAGCCFDWDELALEVRRSLSQLWHLPVPSGSSPEPSASVPLLAVGGRS